MNPFQVAELIYLLHAYGTAIALAKIATDTDIYASPGPKFTREERYNSQAEIALTGLSDQKFNRRIYMPLGVSAALLQILHTLSGSEEIGSPSEFSFSTIRLVEQYRTAPLPRDATTWPEFASLAQLLAKCLLKVKDDHEPSELKSAIKALISWADSLEHAIAAKAKEQTRPALEPTSRTVTGRTAKKKAEKRRSKDER